MNSKTALFLIGLTLCTQARAVDLQPGPGNKVCLAREYTSAHMKRHPNQTLRTLAVIIDNKTKMEEYGYIHARVLGERNGTLFGNRGAGCSYGKDGSVTCSVDCDGGAFKIKPGKNGSALFQVAKDYYFPLFLSGAQPDEGGVPDESNSISLEYREPEDRTYRAYPVDVRWCEEQWNRYAAADFGC